MRAITFVFLLFVHLLTISCAVAIPKQDSDHVVDKPLSNQDHYAEDHNEDYDHEAFLGRDEARTFDDLPPEESQRRLGVIVDKINTNKDDFIDEDELKAWIKFVQRRYIEEDVERQWKDHGLSEQDTLAWDKYKKDVYGGYEPEEEDKVDKHEFSYAKMVQRDKRRWDTADLNTDGEMSKQEYMAFLHPEDYDYMLDIVVLETMEDIDSDGDGYISVDEYIADMYRPSAENEAMPDWVENERKQFENYRDSDGDGKMGPEEVRHWILPPDYDHAEAESKHLIYESDKNNDKRLSKEEILNNFDLFVGSQVTDFGEALNRHEEF